MYFNISTDTWVKKEVITKVLFITALFTVGIIAAYFKFSDVLLISVIFFMTSYNIGTFLGKADFTKLDNIFINFLYGISIHVILIWILTLFGASYKNFFILTFFILLVLQYKMLYKSVGFLAKDIPTLINQYKIVFFVLFIFFIIYLIRAAYPILPSDGSVKHISIPFRMLHQSNWDYNVVESIVFGESSLFGHIVYMYYLSFGIVKLQVINVLFSFLALIGILKIASYFSKNQVYLAATALLYLTYPMLFAISTNLLIDIFILCFTSGLVLLLFKYYENQLTLGDLLPILIVYAGGLYFIKQTTLVFICPVLFALIFLIWCNRKKDHNFSFKNILLTTLFLILFSLPIAVVYYKTGNPIFPFLNETFQSSYFLQSNFHDFRWKNLEYSLFGLYDFIMNSSAYGEVDDGANGFFLFLLLLLPFSIIKFRKNIKFLILLLIFFSSVFLTSKFSGGYIRYFIPSFILVIPLLLLYSVPLSFRNKTFLFYLHSLIIAGIVLYGSYFIFNKNIYGFYWRFDTFHKHSEVLQIENKSILEEINFSNVWLLSNNDISKGVFLGHFIDLSWYNTYLINKLLNQKEISDVLFLQNFDYYLIRKNIPLNLSDRFDPSNPLIATILEKYREDDEYILYKVKSLKKLILDKVLLNSAKVTVTEAIEEKFENNSDNYIIELELEPSVGNESRFQISWLDTKRRLIKNTLIPFKLDDGKKIYQSRLISDVPKNAKYGILFVTSHDEKPIIVYAYRLLAITKDKTIYSLEQQYGERFPHIAKKYNEPQ